MFSVVDRELGQERSKKVPGFFRIQPGFFYPHSTCYRSHSLNYLADSESDLVVVPDEHQRSDVWQQIFSQVRNDKIGIGTDKEEK